MYLHSVWQSGVQHGEDGQIGAQVRNHSTGRTLQRDMWAHVSYSSSICVFLMQWFVLIFFLLNGLRLDDKASRSEQHCGFPLQLRRMCIWLIKDPEATSSEAKDRFGSTPRQRYSTHTEGDQLSLLLELYNVTPPQVQNDSKAISHDKMITFCNIPAVKQHI